MWNVSCWAHTHTRTCLKGSNNEVSVQTQIRVELVRVPGSTYILSTWFMDQVRQERPRPWRCTAVGPRNRGQRGTLEFFLRKTETTESPNCFWRLWADRKGPWNSSFFSLGVSRPNFNLPSRCDEHQELAVGKPSLPSIPPVLCPS